MRFSFDFLFISRLYNKLQMANNLFEVVRYDDLVAKLHEGVGKFVVLAATVDETKDALKYMLRKYIKAKSKLYPKVTFLYYKVQKADLGKLKPMFNADLTEYPKLFHIYNVEVILESNTKIDGNEALEPMFTRMHEHYLIGEGKKQPPQQPSQQQQHQSTAAATTPADDDDEPERYGEEAGEEVAGEEVADEEVADEEAAAEVAVVIKKNPQLEQQKLIEKLRLLTQKRDECEMAFFDECKNRKKKEEKKKEKPK